MSVILTPDQRLRVFVSSTLAELADERRGVRRAVEELGLTPVLFEMGARPHPPRELYRAYLAQSDVFVGIYWERYGWVAPGEKVSGLEDEYLLAGARPRLMYVKTPAPGREPRLAGLLDRIRADAGATVREFSAADELPDLVAEDLMRLLADRFAGPATREAAQRAPERQVDSALPAPVTALIGRDTELAEVTALLRDDGVRLVTLTGPGGIGKTRLAVAVAERVAGEFADGVVFVSLAEVTGPDDVPAALAAAVGVTEVSPGAALAAVTARLRRRHVLLVVDNLEHVVDAAPCLAQLLTECARLSVLATSRVRLQLSAEHDFPLRPLPVPPRSVRTGDVAAYDAVRLFVDRALAVGGEVDLTRDGAAVAEIVRRVDGLPLAVELAAARSRLLSPDALLARLDASLRLLSSGARDLPERQRTLRATIDWSYGLLSEPDRRLFARLAVFRGGRSLEAVEVVCNEAGDLDVLAGLGALLDGSLVTQQPGIGGEPRFVMLETIYDYARERLGDSGQLAALQAAHARYFADLVARAARELRGSGQVVWLARLAEEHANLQAAMAHAAEVDDPRLGLSIAAVSLYWAVRGSPSEGLQWLTRFLAADRGRVPEALRARAVTAAGLLAIDLGDLATAHDHFTEATELYRRLGDEQGLGKALNGLAVVASHRREFERAAELYQQSGELRERGGDTASVAQTHNNVGFVSLCRGDLPAARAHLDQAQQLAHAAGNAQLESIVLGNLAVLSLHDGDADAAGAYVGAAMRLAADLGDVVGVASALEISAAVAVERGHAGDAPRLWSSAAALREEAGTRPEAADLALLAPFIERGGADLGEGGDFTSAVAAAVGLGPEEAMALARDVATR